MPNFANYSNHYTGANVTVRIGPHQLTQCFGISWQVSQTKRPIYGYHDQHFSAVSNGVVLVQGQLFINFVHSGYLSAILQEYLVFRNDIRGLLSSGSNVDLLSYIRSTGRVEVMAAMIRDILDPPLGVGGDGEIARTTYDYVGVLNDLTNRDTLDSYLYPDAQYLVNGGDDRDRTVPLNMSNSQRTRALDSVLDRIFNDDDIRGDLINYFTGGFIAGTNQIIDQTTNATESFVSVGDSLSSIVDRNVDLGTASSAVMKMARPDQFGSGYSSPYGFDIVVHFGPPYGGQEQNRIISYSNRSSFVLKDCHFIGESGQVMSNDEPVMEVYNFFARKKDTIPRSSQTERL